MPWQLWRQDDNGQRFLVGEFARRDQAEQRLAALTRCHHKQIYWLSESAAPPAGSKAVDTP